MNALQQRLADAWRQLKARVEAADTGLAAAIKKSQNLDATEHRVMEICSLMNPLWGGGGNAWEARGDGTITLSGIRVTKLDGVQQAPAGFPSPPPADRVSLPVSFQSLTVEGKFDLNQPCVEMGMFGAIGSPSPCRQGGTFVRSYGAGTLAFLGSLAGKLTIDNVSLSGTPDMHIDITGGLPAAFAHLVAPIMDFLMGPVERTLVAHLNDPAAMPGAAAFSKEMIDELNKIIAPPHP